MYIQSAQHNSTWSRPLWYLNRAGSCRSIPLGCSKTLCPSSCPSQLSQLSWMAGDAEINFTNRAIPLIRAGREGISSPSSHHKHKHYITKSPKAASKPLRWVFIGVTNISRLLLLFPGAGLLDLIVFAGSHHFHSRDLVLKGEVGTAQPLLQQGRQHSALLVRGKGHHRYWPILVNVFKGLSIVNGEDAQEALPRPHVLVSHGAVLLLSCCVQDV